MNLSYFSTSNDSFEHCVIGGGGPSPSETKKGRFKKDALEHVDYAKEYKMDPKYKTEMCKSWSEAGFCPYGNKCRFAHGKQELFDKVVNCKKYKQKECMSFFKNKYCNYGSRCHFRHAESNLQDIPRTQHSMLLSLYNTIENPLEVENEIFQLLLSQNKPLKRLNAFTQITKKLYNPSHNLKNTRFYLNTLENMVNKPKFSLGYCNIVPLI